MNTITFEGEIIYWIAVKEGAYAGHGLLETNPSVVSSKWSLEAYTDRNTWKTRLINDFGIDPDTEETP